MSLFQPIPNTGAADTTRPLADRMRPRTLNEYAGQEHLIGPGKPLKAEPADAKEFASRKRAGLARLQDASNTALALESRLLIACAAVAANPLRITAAAINIHFFILISFSCLSSFVVILRPSWVRASSCHYGPLDKEQTRRRFRSLIILLAITL